jgi:hypothetical protein
MFKQVVLAVLMATAVGAQAQGTPGKKEVVAKVVQLLQPVVEGMAVQLVQQPALQVQQGAGVALQRIPAERREALARDIEADLRKYAEEIVPIARSRATKLAPSTIGPLLDERFTEEELRQLVALLESPVNRKFQQVFPDIQRALAEKFVADMRPEIEPRARALDQSVGKRLGVTPAAPAASGARK